MFSPSDNNDNQQSSSYNQQPSHPISLDEMLKREEEMKINKRQLPSINHHK